MNGMNGPPAPVVTAPPTYEWNVSSENRIRDNPNDPLNPTNNISVPLNMIRTRPPLLEMSLASLEMKPSQYMVESQWNRIFFDEGIRLAILDPMADDSIRSIELLVNSESFLVQLPLFLNMITNVDVTDPTRPIFTTEYDHGLEFMNLWTWDPIQMIATAITHAADQVLTGSNVTVLSPNQFRLTLAGAPPAGYVSGNAVLGFVYAPVIPNLSTLARLIQTGFNNVVTQGTVVFQYQETTGLFVVQFHPASSTLSSIHTVQLSVPSDYSLAFMLGLGFGSIALRPTDGYFALSDQLGYQGPGQLYIDPGNYGFDSVASQIQLQWNRFWFDGGLTNPAGSRPVFVFSSSNGASASFAIDYGRYTIDTFTEMLAAKMTAADPLSNTYSVTYDATAGQMVFQCTVPGQTFGLEFAEATQTLNPALLGFDTLSYRGQSMYKSPFPFFMPMMPLPRSGRYASFVYQVRLANSQHTYQWQVAKPRFITVAQATDNGSGLLEVTTGIAPLIAHGLQPDDIVTVRDTASGAMMQFPVQKVTDAFTVLLDLGTATAPFAGAAALDVSFGLSGLTPVNLYWAYPRKSRLPSKFVGFGAMDQTFYDTAMSPFRAELCRVPYVLLCLPNLNGDTRNNHYWQSVQHTGNIPNVFAKVILYPEFRLERIYPMRMEFPATLNVDQVQFVFLNPDHSVYQLHGTEWSATLLLVVNEMPMMIQSGPLSCL